MKKIDAARAEGHKERKGEFWCIEDTWYIHVQDLYREACAARGDRAGDFTYDGGDLRRHLRERTPGRISQILVAAPELELAEMVRSQGGDPGDPRIGAALGQTIGAEAPWEMHLSSGKGVSWLRIVAQDGRSLQWSMAFRDISRPKKRSGRMVKRSLLGNLIGGKVQGTLAYVVDEQGQRFKDIFLTLDGRMGDRLALELSYSIQNVGRKKHAQLWQQNREQVIREMLERRGIKLPELRIKEMAANTHFHFEPEIGPRGKRYFDSRPSGMRWKAFDKLNGWLAAGKRYKPPRLRHSFGPHPTAPYRNSMGYEMATDPPAAGQARAEQRAAERQPHTAPPNTTMRCRQPHVRWPRTTIPPTATTTAAGVSGLVPPLSSMTMQAMRPSLSPSGPSASTDKAALAEVEGVFAAPRRNQSGRQI